MTTKVSANELLRRVYETPKPRIAVVGDIVLDVYSIGVAAESAEQSVKFVEDTVRTHPGMAGNAHRQLEHWQCERSLFGCHVGARVRYMQEDEVLFRLDDDSPPIRANAEQQIDDLLERLADNQFDAVLITDHDAGTLTVEDTQAICLTAHEHRVICVVDPKNKPPEAYPHAIIKCNERYQHLAMLLRGSRTQSAVVTRGGRLTRLYDFLGFDRKIGAPFECQFRSAVGAGDAFSAALVATLCRGYDLEQSAAVADAAARVFVGMRFASPVFPSQAALCDWPYGKIIDNMEYLPFREEADAPDAGCRFAIAVGCFAQIHPGHLHTLRWAAQHGPLLVAMNTNESIQRSKGYTPSLSTDARARLLAEFDFVTCVVPFDTDEQFVELVRRAKPVAIIKGDDSRGKPIPGSDLAPVLYAPPSDYAGHSIDGATQ